MPVNKPKRANANKRLPQTKKKLSNKPQAEPDKLRTEIEILVMFAVSVVLFIGVLGGGRGPLLFIGGFLFGLFGILGYIFPVALFFIYTFIKANYGNKKMKGKAIAFTAIFLSMDSLIFTISHDMSQKYSISSIYLNAIKHKNGGGVIGSIIPSILYGFAGKIVTIFILIIIFIICLIVVTQRSFIGGIQKSSHRVYNSTVTNIRQRRVDNEKSNIIRNTVSEDEMSSKYAKILDIDINNKKVSDIRPLEFTKNTGLKPNALGTNVGMREINLNAYKETEYDEYDGEDGYTDDGYENDTLMNGSSISMPKIEPLPEPKLEYKLEGVELKRVEPVSMFTSENTDSDMSEEQGEDIDESVVGSADYEDNIYEEFAGAAYLKNRIDAHNEDVEENININIDESIKEAVSTKNTENIKDTKKVDNSTIPTDYNEADKIKTDSDIISTDEYVFPPIELLKSGSVINTKDEATINATMLKLKETFESFNVAVTMEGVSVGPTVTRYELSPAPGVKVSRIQGLADDIKLALAAADIRIEAPIPGKSYVGIEVPNKENSTVMLRDLLQDKAFKENKCKLAFAVGKDLANKTIVEDISKMPHLLIAGATGSGKSVCINTLIMSILYTCSPKDVRLIMIDPKVVELSVYNGIPHLLAPIVTDAKKAAGALNWAVVQMTKRYQLFAAAGVRDLIGYNRWINDPANKETVDEQGLTVLPKIVIIVDELADLMMVSAKEAEEAICRLAQLARAAGIHLILATQRPSVNVITGLIKANMPSRIAFSVTSGVDSRTILDMNGAEKLLGKGDMLFAPQWLQMPVRLQGAFISDEEVERVTSFLKERAKESKENIEENVEEEIVMATNQSLMDSMSAGGEESDGLDALFFDAASLVVGKEKASIGMLQRALRIGFNRAGRIMDQMEAYGIVGADEGTKPRAVLMNMEQLEELKKSL